MRVAMRVSFLLSLLTLTLLSGPMGLAQPGESNPSGPSQGAISAQDRSPSAGYPFVYRQVGYLATSGPAPMRFSAQTPGGSDRTPPRITVPKKPELSRTAEGMARTEAIEAYRSIFGRGLPVPAGSPEGGPKVPDAFFDAGNGLGSGGPNGEVLEFFQQPAPEPDVQKRQNRFLFDPVFQAARPPAPPVAPQSRATYRN
jgi:hypothetical protein